MSNNSSFPKLFEQASIGKLKLKNRLIMLPMGTGYASAAGEVTQRTIDHYVERAKGGVGAITVGNISPFSPNAINQLALDSEWMLMGHYELVEKVHAHGAKITAQINYAGKQKYIDAIRPGEKLYSSSAVPTKFLGKVYPKPKALTEKEIYQFIEKYVNTAERAKRVGYDMVELHGSHGYFINQFISPFMNKRKDKFGGSLENRMRFPVELVRAMRQALGPDFPIGFRISADEFVPGGVTLKESTRIAKILEKAGVDYISVSAGVFETVYKFIDLMRDPEGWKDYLWEGIKKEVSVPIIAGGGLRHPAFCEKILIDGKGDFVGLGRPLLADPEWPLKAREGNVEEIRRCISCNECLYGSGRRRKGGGARRCTVNAASGRDREFIEIKPAVRQKKVWVVGSGPAGMEAARTAAMRGHEVTLFEKNDSLGGQMLLASKPQGKRRILWLRDYLVRQMEKHGVKIETGIEVTPQMVEEGKPDTVVVATGAGPIMPNIPGLQGKNVVSSWDILTDKVLPRNARVAVVGGGMVGCEIAEYLLELGNKLIIIEQLPSLAPDMEPNHRFEMLQRFEQEKNLKIKTGHKVLQISDNSIRMQNLQGRKESVTADWVVIAVGTKPVNALKDALEGKVQELYSLGDCNQPRIIMEAIYDGALAGRQI